MLVTFHLWRCFVFFEGFSKEKVATKKTFQGCEGWGGRPACCSRHEGAGVGRWAWGNCTKVSFFRGNCTEVIFWRQLHRGDFVHQLSLNQMLLFQMGGPVHLWPRQQEDDAGRDAGRPKHLPVPKLRPNRSRWTWCCRKYPSSGGSCTFNSVEELNQDDLSNFNFCFWIVLSTICIAGLVWWSV